MTILSDFLVDLAELVNRDCGTANFAGVTSAAEIMKRHFESIGFSAELVDLGEKAGRGLFATNKPGAEHFDILVNGHLDTVFPDGEAAERPFSYDEKRAYGPGAVDCKAGILSAFYGLKYADKQALERLSIAVALNPDEETGSLSSTKWLYEIGKKSSRAMIVEPARKNGEFVRSRKGSANLLVKFHGKSAHAGNNPQAGCNAAVAMMRFATAIYEFNDFERGTTVNPGVIEGGKISNAIPDYASVKIDTRYWNDEDGRELIAKIRAAAEETYVEGVTSEFEQLSWIPAMPLSDLAKEFDAQIAKASETAGFEAKFVDAGGASDGNHIAEAGIPVVDGCGPAGDGLHTKAEYVDLSTVENRVLMQASLYSLL